MSVDLTCDEALPPAFLAKNLTTSPVAPTSPTNMQDYAANATNATFHIRALGGLDCAWWDGVSFNGDGNDPAYATVTIVPLARTVAQKLTRPYPTRPSAEGCFGGVDTSIGCYLVSYANGYYVDVYLYGLDGDAASDDPRPASAAVKAVFDAIMDRVRHSATPTDTWKTPAGALALPSRCGDLLTRGQLTTALDSRKPLYFGGFGGAYGAHNAELAATGSPLCTLQLRQVGPYTADRSGYLGWLSGGAWAAAEQAKRHASTSVRVSGLRPGESASIYWSRPGAELTADLVIGGSWIEFTLHAPGAGTPRLGVTTEVAAQRLMTQMVANLR